MRPTPLFSTAAIAALSLASPSLAQLAEPPAFAQEAAYPYDSGVFTNSGARTELLHRQRIHVPGAPSLRVFFSEINLHERDYLDVVSPREGTSHRITPEEIGKWSSSSAFFNGEQLELQLYVAPGSHASYAISHLLVGTDGDSGAGDSICFGADDRVPTVDNRVSRFLNSSGTSACTGWLSGADSCAFSAGHCFPGYTSIAEFNVPPSTTSGALVHPPPEFQFPIDPDSLVWTSGGIGNDWAICHLETNTLGETASAKFGYFNLGFFLPTTGQTTRISGFGSDDGTADQTLQTHTGPYAGTSGTNLRYTVDTTGGNSGSPVIHEPTGDAVGIHTHAGCDSGGNYNNGTSLTLSSFLTAWNNECAHGPPGVPVAEFSAASTAVVQTQSVSFTDDSTGIPESWDWDFDEDGVTDSVEKNPTFTFNAPGTYDVTLAVVNSFGSDSITKVDLITVSPIAPTAMPYAQDFQGGLPATGEWLFTSSSDSGAIAAGASGTASPGSGSPSLTMASSVDGTYVQNDAKLFLDASQYGGLSVSYWFKQTSDEDDPEDGLFISDGVTEWLALSHQGASSAWTQLSVDPTVLAQLVGVQLNKDFHLIFRQYDNYSLGTDGHLVDDIVVTPWPHLDGDVASISLSAGGTQVLSLEAGVARAADSYWVIGSFSGTSPGTSIGGIVLPLSTPDTYFNFTVNHPNEAPLTSSLGTLAADGSGVALFTVPAGTNGGLAGVQVNHAYVAYDPGSFAVTLVSNPEPVQLTP